MEGEKCRLEAGPPAGPQPREPEPEDAVAATKPRATDGSLQDGQLMTQGDVQAPRIRIITGPNGMNG